MFFSLLSLMGVGENLALCPGKEVRETERGGERVGAADEAWSWVT